MIMREIPLYEVIQSNPANMYLNKYNFGVLGMLLQTKFVYLIAKHVLLQALPGIAANNLKLQICL